MRGALIGGRALGPGGASRMEAGGRPSWLEGRGQSLGPEAKDKLILVSARDQLDVPFLN